MRWGCGSVALPSWRLLAGEQEGKDSVLFKELATESLTAFQWIYRQIGCFFILFLIHILILPLWGGSQGWQGHGRIGKSVWLGCMMWNFQGLRINKNVMLRKKKGKKKTSNSFGIQSQLDLEENEEPQDKINYIQGCNCSTLLDDKGRERTLEHGEKPGYVQNIHLCVWYVPMCLCMCMCACLSVCEPACTERPEVNCRCFSLPLPPYFTSQSLCLNLEFTHWGPGTHPSQTPQPPPPELGL